MPGRVFQQLEQAPKLQGRVFKESAPQVSQGRVFGTPNPVPGETNIGIREVAQEIPSTIGGMVGKLSDILLTGQRVSALGARKILGLEPKPFKEGDYIDIIEDLGNKIQPKSNLGKILLGKSEYKPDENVVRGTLKELPHVAIGTLLNIFTDPTLFLGKLGVISKTTGVIGSTLGKIVKTAERTVPGVKATSEIIQRALVPRALQPELFKELDRARIIEENMAKQEVGELVEPIVQQGRTVQRRIAQVIKGGITTDEDIKRMATPIREELDRVGENISKLNPKLLSEETFLENKGIYFPRLYTKHEFPVEEQIQRFFPSKPLRVPGERFKPRKDLPDEVRRELGEITEAGFPALKGLTQLRVAETRLKFFKKVSDTWASDIPNGELVQLAESKLLGDLSGKFVPPSIANVINELYRVPTGPERLYKDGLRLWKSFKTAYNPATISRNDLTNYFLLNPLGGVPPWRLDIYAKTTKEMLSNGPKYKLAQRNGLNISQFAGEELRNKSGELYKQQKDIISQFFPTAESFHRKVVDFYGNQDRFFKLANFIKGVDEDGLTPLQAMRRANFYLVDYSEMPELVKFLRNSPIGAPFVSFSYGVSLPLAKTLLERPDKLANYFKILNGIQQLDPYKTTKEQQLREYQQLPDYIKNGQFLRLPWKDKTGRLQYLDLTYILPFNILESRGTGIFSKPILSSTIGQNPLFSLFSDISKNKSGFTGREIYSELDSDNDKKLKIMKYAWQQLAPNNPLIPESWSFEKMQDTGVFPRISDGELHFEPRPDRLGRERNKVLGILDSVFGVKITPTSPSQEQLIKVKKRRSEIFEIQKQLRILNIRKDLIPSERRVKREKLQLKLRELTAPLGAE